MKFILVRHGETDYNNENRIQGVINRLLNNKGRNQAKGVRGELKDTKIEYCYVSPLVRCVETAMIIIGDRVEMIPDKRLIERNMGELEGELGSSYDPTSYWDFSLNLSERGIECIKDIYDRCKSFLDYVINKYDNDATILIVTHAAPLRMMYHILNRTDLNSSLLFDIKNCEYRQIEINKDNFI